MFTKTTSFAFSEYGEIVNKSEYKFPQKNIHSTLRIKEKSFTSFLSYDHDVYIQATSGIVMLVVCKEGDIKAPEQFIIHRTIKIKKGILFNFISISHSARILMNTDTKAKKTTHPLPKDAPIVYEPIIPSFEIKEILSYFYQVRNASYEFPGEEHEFWELTFIDNGELTTTVNDEEYNLDEMDLILYSPGQYHTQKTGHSKSCSYLTILFDMELPDAYLLTDRVYHAHRDIQNALNNFIKVSSNDMLYDNELMLCYLKELIIRILQYDFLSSSPIASTPMQQRFENELLNEIIVYINDMIYKQLTIEEICNKFSISRSSLQLLFKNNLGTAPKQYISDLKLNKSKHLIKESMYTISEIASMLGFTSIHYFSRKFKQQFGITPTDYAKTIYN
ncbi:AraC family transcriptional regulator [Amedibacterium intestinale]|uniref:AraC family transcriptional regulator n=1 Tax=Amedibacterium intestinale TaxID=2583452 RepID=UPI000E4AC5D3|nr:AraC family transcriptional regulator [Amedibacterium intestinale]RHO22447.1 AraC family transcriptional regulator [Eubacterium sp. AM18-26]RHO24520.1 AraC family transcriptional regulator [Eubacterium sp. AM18-10LB-B]